MAVSRRMGHCQNLRSLGKEGAVGARVDTAVTGGQNPGRLWRA